MNTPSLNAAIVAAASLTQAHVAAAIANGRGVPEGTSEVLSWFGSYLDEVRSGRHQSEPPTGR